MTTNPATKFENPDNLQPLTPQRTTLSTDERAQLIVALECIQDRVLWLSTLSIHHANNVRPNTDEVKVGGHQASSASLVSIMTALYFYWLRPEDRIAIKPHASPVLHTINALLGKLPVERLRELRSYKGLQAYPSRTKDPDPVDFSTGSVGMGAVAPNFAALTKAYIAEHFGATRSGRFVAVIGDAELNEGNIWEALSEEQLLGLKNVLWIIDLNRQSLDHITSQGQYKKYIDMFQALGWRVVMLKYGRKLQAAFRQPGGEQLREIIDQMPPREYHSLLNLDGATLREKLVKIEASLEKVLSLYSDEEVKGLIADLGGHDLDRIVEVLDTVEEFLEERPVVVFAYTIKGWGLPFALDSLNHAALLSTEQIEDLRQRLDIPEDLNFRTFNSDSLAGKYISHFIKGRERPATAPREPQAFVEIPESLDLRYRPQISTQQAFGQIIFSLARSPALAERIVTASPDVAISTNLGGWVNKFGVYGLEPKRDYFELHGIKHPIVWQKSPSGQHIELGIAENNLFLLLGALGLSYEFEGELLFPIGTIYDTFIRRGLGAFHYALYSGAKFIVVGTPSGITLSPEGGAHQSIVSASIGLEMPNITTYEPAFAHEVEWILIDGLRSILDRKNGHSTYLRLSTRPIDQKLLSSRLLDDTQNSERLRQAVLQGGYRLIDHSSTDGYDVGENVVNIFASGVLVSEAVEASRALVAEGIFANVYVVTSPDKLHHDYIIDNRRRMENSLQYSPCYLHQLVPASERRAPAVTVVDAHSHNLSFIGSFLGARTVSLGVNEFGQSGSREALYDHYGIGTKSIIQAAWRAATML